MIAISGYVAFMMKEINHRFRDRKRACFAAILSFFFFIFFLSLSASTQKEKEGTRLNVLLITIDTLRPDRLSCYGSPFLKTPYMDALADRGVLFTRAFAHTTTTLPSHTNILLGSTPLFHGVHDNNNFVVPQQHLTLAEHLKKNGYATGAFVGAYVLDSRFGLNQGFDVYDDKYERSHQKKISLAERKAEEVVGSALGWLKNQRSPWFLWIHCYDPHDPYEPPEPFQTQYRKNPYDGEVAYVDFALERLLTYLEETALFEETIVVFTGDHGESLGQHEEATHGFLAYNSTLWIPLIIAFPGAKKTQVNQYVSHIDIFPTLCDLLQLEKPSSLQGLPLLPLIKGRKLPSRPIYFESLYPFYSRGWAPIRGILSAKEKFIDSPLPEIYDLDKDFDELINLAGRKNLARYRQKLDAILKGQSSPDAAQARRALDREALEKLKSLGYLSSSPVVKKEKFGPDDDVKAFLPYNNMAVQAIELCAQGRSGEAIELLKKVICEKKNLDSAYYNLAIILEKEQRIEEGLQILRSGMENIPESYELFFNYVTMAVKAGAFDEAITIFQEKRFLQMETDPELLNEVGIAYSREDRLEQAIVLFEKALALDSQYPALHNNQGNAYLSLALKEKDARALQKAIQNFKKAIEIDAQYPFPYLGLGSAYRQAGNLDGAIHCWEKAIELNPDFVTILYRLGLAYMEKEDYRKSLYFFSQYQRRSPSLPEEVRKNVESLIRACKAKLQ